MERAANVAYKRPKISNCKRAATLSPNRHASMP